MVEIFIPTSHFIISCPFCAYSQVEVIYSKAYLLFQSLAHCGKVFHLEDSG